MPTRNIFLAAPDVFVGMANKASSKVTPGQCAAQRHGGDAALIVLHHPLPQFEGGKGKDQGDVALVLVGAGARLHDQGIGLFLHAHDRLVAHKVDSVIQQNAQRRVGQAVAIHRVEPGIADIDIAAGGHDQGGAGRFIGKTHPAGLFDIERALVELAAGSQLHEIAFQGADGIEIGADLGEIGLLLRGEFDWALRRGLTRPAQSQYKTECAKQKGGAAEGFAGHVTRLSPSPLDRISAVRE